MSKSGKRIDDQFTIFDLLQRDSKPSGKVEGQLNIADRLRSAMRLAIKQSPLSIHQIAGEMSHHLGETVTADQIYSWTRDSDENNGRNRRHVPAEYMAAFVFVTGCDEPLKAISKPAGIFTLPGPEALRAEIQRIDEEIKKAQSKKRRRMAFLTEIEGPGDEGA